MCVLHQVDGISIGSLDDIPGTSVTNFFRSIRSTLDFDFEDEDEGIAKTTILSSNSFPIDFCLC